MRPRVEFSHGFKAIALFLFASTAAAAATLEIKPNEVLEGDPVSIRVIAAPPGSLATIHAQSVMVTEAGKRIPFYAHATYRVGASGEVDLASSPSLSGSYYGTDIRGLFWSQERVVAGTTPTSPAMVDSDQLKPDQVLLTLHLAGRVGDRKMVSLLSSNADVVREQVSANALVGAFYHQRGASRRPIVVILHGSEGGLGYADWLAPMLVSRGYSVFGLNYFSPQTSASAGVSTSFNLIPVEQLERVQAWLAKRPEADVGRFGIVGASKGGEFALVLASIYPWIDAVAAFTPSAHVTQGFRYGSGEIGMSSSWTRNGRPLPFIPATGLSEAVRNYRIPGGEVRLAPVREANLVRASAKLLEQASIKVERSRAAFLLVGGGDDQTGASGDSVRLVSERLKRAGYNHQVDARIYPDAGHLIVDTGWRPTTTHNSGPSQDGGNAEADARAQADSWTAMIEFLRRNLKP